MLGKQVCYHLSMILPVGKVKVRAASRQMVSQIKEEGINTGVSTITEVAVDGTAGG